MHLFSSRCRRLIALAVVSALLCMANVAAAKSPAIDRERASAAFALAQHYWVQAGLDRLPSRYDRARFQKAVQGEDDPYNIVAAIAVATLNSNPGREDAVFSYLNNALLPFAGSHKRQYLCMVAEVIYNSQDSIEEIRAQAKAGGSTTGMAIAFIDYAYFLIKTEPAREKLKLVVPVDNGVPESVAAFKKTLTPEAGSLIPAEAVRLDCDHS